jgi:hypothetical protein
MRDTIDMAREAGFNLEQGFLLRVTGIDEDLKAFEALVRADQREIDAKVCDDKHDTWRWDNEADSASGPRDCAAAIRNMGNT